MSILFYTFNILDKTGQFYNKILIGRPDIKTTTIASPPHTEDKHGLHKKQTESNRTSKVPTKSYKVLTPTQGIQKKENNPVSREFEIKLLKIREDILEEIKNGAYKMEIAPSDLVDFGGQRSFDMTHQLFVQHKGTFVLMIDGRYNLDHELPEYRPAKLTSGCKYQFEFKYYISSKIKELLKNKLNKSCYR